MSRACQLMLHSAEPTYARDRQRLLIVASMIEGLRWDVSPLVDKDMEKKFSRLAAELRKWALGDLE